jgi:hypothetical protein
MVKKLTKKIMLSMILSIICYQVSIAQEQKTYSVLSKYSKWSFVVGPSLYNKAKLTPQYGNDIPKSKRMPNIHFGITYDFHPDKKWSFVTGLLVAKEPIYSVEYEFNTYDLYEEYREEPIYMDKFKSYALYTFSFPILLRFNLQISKNKFLAFQIGLKAIYFPPGEEDLIVAFSSEELMETREVFGLKLESPTNSMQGSFVIGAGFSWAMKKILFKTDFIYVMNFQNTISGEYQYANLLVSPDSRGYYDLSGNYLGLLFSVNLKKGKKER